MQIQDISIKDYAAFVENFFINYNRDNMAYYETKIKKVLKCKDFVTVLVKQPRQYAYGSIAVHNYRIVFQNADNNKLYAILEKDLGKTSLFGKKRFVTTEISDVANTFFENYLQEDDESSM